MPRNDYTDDHRSDYPGRSTIDWLRPSSSRTYTTREHSPFDSAGLDPTAFRRNAMSFDTRSGPQPRDYRHYDVQPDTYAARDSGYTQRGRDNYESENRYGGGNRLSRDVARMRSGGGGGSGYESYGSSSRRNSSSRDGSKYGGRDSRDRDYESSSRSRSGFATFLRSSASARGHRDRSPRPSRRSSSSRYFSPDDLGRRSSSCRPSYSGSGYGGGYDDDGYGSSNGYQTRVVTPGSGDYSSSRRSRAVRTTAGS